MRRRAGVSSVSALALALLLVPDAALAASGSPGHGLLSPRLAELAKPLVRSLPPARQARALSLARSGPGSLLRRGNRVLVDVRFDHGAAAGVVGLRAAGAQVVNVSRRYQTVTVAAKPAGLRALAGVANVAGVTEVLTPMTFATCPSGATVSEGDSQLHAAEARSGFGVDGSGVTVGILSDSFDQASHAAVGSGLVATHAREDEESGDLPGVRNPCGQTTPVDVLENDLFEPEKEEPADEGRGMAQIVHDLAPSANLAFASAFNGEPAFAKSIERLAKPISEGGAGAQVIADDVAYFEEPFFQDGPVADAINQVSSKGVDYFTAAGNDNLIDSEGHEIGSWETPEFRDAGSCPPEVQAVPSANGTHCLNFNPGSQTDKTFGIRVKPGATLTVDLQWDEPWNGVSTNLDAFLLNANGNLIAASREDNVKVSQQPIEVLQWVNETGSRRTVQLVINRFSGGNPRLKFVLLENGFGVAATEYPRSTGKDVVGPTVFGHSGAANAISVGAVPFYKSSEAEEYSSRGPVRHDFGPVEGSAPATKLLAPEILSKPDVAATDCGKTTFFAMLVEFEGEDAWRFCGTSSSAPHAAAVAALMRDKESAAEPAEIRTALQASATAVGTYGPCSVGAGLVEAVGAIEDLVSPKPFSPAECSPPEPGSVEEARAPGEWGLEAPPPPPNVVTQTPTEPSHSLPRTFFLRHPGKLIRTRRRKAKAVFRFGSNERGVTFICRVDGGPSRVCRERFVRRFGIGKHSLKVAARDAAGNVDPTPAVFRFRVERIG
jgi:Subtilase family